jgi:hypothetical protein
MINDISDNSSFNAILDITLLLTGYLGDTHAFAGDTIGYTVGFREAILGVPPFNSSAEHGRMYSL